MFLIDYMVVHMKYIVIQRFLARLHMPLKVARHPTRLRPKFQSQYPDLTHWSQRVSQKVSEARTSEKMVFYVSANSIGVFSIRCSFKLLFIYFISFLYFLPKPSSVQNTFKFAFYTNHSRLRYPVETNLQRQFF